MFRCVDHPRQHTRKSRISDNFETQGSRLHCIPEEIINKSSDVYQKIEWDILQKSIHDLISNVNAKANIKKIYKKLLNLNILRGKGLFCHYLLKAQYASVKNTQYYSALVSYVNLKFPKIGELLVARCILQLKLPCYENNKSSVIFIAHLINHRVADTTLAIDLLKQIMMSPTRRLLYLALTFMSICGYKLKEVNEKGINEVLDTMHNTLIKSSLNDEVWCLMEVQWHFIKRVKFVNTIVDLLQDKSQNTHILSVDAVIDPLHYLDYFHYDPKYDYEANENIYKLFCEQVLEEKITKSAVFMYDSDTDNEINQHAIKRNVHQHVLSLRTTINVMLDTSFGYKDIARKLMDIKLRPGLEMDVCNMFLNFFCEHKVYTANLGYTAQIFCQLNNSFVPLLERTFIDSYMSVQNFNSKKLHNAAKFFSYLLFTNTISWMVLSTIRLNKFETTSSSIKYIKYIFLDIVEHIGYARLNACVIQDPSLKEALKIILFGDRKKMSKFAIKFLTSIGLEGLIKTLKYLK